MSENLDDVRARVEAMRQHLTSVLACISSPRQNLDQAELDLILLRTHLDYASRALASELCRPDGETIPYRDGR